MKKLSLILLCVTLNLNAMAVMPKQKSTSKEVVDLSLLDTKMNPCEDFFQYSCGNWLKNNPVPADKSSLYRFTEIDENTLVILKTILESYQKGQIDPPQKDAKKLADTYSACLNVSANDVASIGELRKLVSKVELLQHKEDLMTLVAFLHREGINPFFGIYSMQNPGDATKMIGVVDQAGLGLPEKGYYFDEESKAIRTQYLKHIENSLNLAGINDARELSLKIYKLEIAIAKFSLSAQEQQDPIKTYNPIGKAALQKLSPNLDWNKYFDGVGHDKADRLDVVSPVYFKSLARLIEKTNLRILKAYMVWTSVRETSAFATTKLQNEHFNFYGTILNGTKEREPRWKSCIWAVDSMFGESLGEAFVKVAFGNDAKNLTKKMVQDIKVALKDTVEKIDWMDDETKVGAFKKIATFNQKIGYPEKFKDYSDLNIDKNSWFKNKIAANRFYFDEYIKKSNRAVDRASWEMTPATNNAYYNPTMNEIVFPAGILQAPLFNVDSILAANYGATGATIGHELTHGFDDSGSQYDELGNLKNWWSESSAKVYADKGQCIVEQFNDYTIDDGTHLDGKLTLGENIADLGGLKLALSAFVKTQAKMNPELLKTFFIAYAQSWCGHLTKEAQHTQINTDVHANAKFRVNGAVSNLPEFEGAFQCKSGDSMAPKNRCSVW